MKKCFYARPLPRRRWVCWVHRAVLALDQWDKLLESGQLWQIAQKENSLPLQKTGVLSPRVVPHPPPPPPSPRRKGVRWNGGECFFSFLLKALREVGFFSRFASSPVLWRVRGRGWGRGGGGGAYRRPPRVSPRLHAETSRLTRKLHKAEARPEAHDGRPSSTTCLVLVMLVLINQGLRETLPQGGTASVWHPPLEQRGQCSFSLGSGPTCVSSSVKLLTPVCLLWAAAALDPPASKDIL